MQAPATVPSRAMLMSVKSSITTGTTGWSVRRTQHLGPTGLSIPCAGAMVKQVRQRQKWHGGRLISFWSAQPCGSPDVCCISPLRAETLAKTGMMKTNRNVNSRPARCPIGMPLKTRKYGNPCSLNVLHFKRSQWIIAFVQAREP